MSTPLTAVTPVPLSPGRDALPSLALPRPAAPVESALAPQPVGAAARPADPRGEALRDRPVGPPPAFEINVLEALRARAADPGAEAGRAGGGTPSGVDAGPVSSPPPGLDRKI